MCVVPNPSPHYTPPRPRPDSEHLSGTSPSETYVPLRATNSLTSATQTLCNYILWNTCIFLHSSAVHCMQCPTLPRRLQINVRSKNGSRTLRHQTLTMIWPTARLNTQNANTTKWGHSEQSRCFLPQADSTLQDQSLNQTGDSPPAGSQNRLIVN